jgi:transposase
MIPMPSGVRVWIAAGHTDMRRGMQGLALQVQEQLKRDPHLCVGRDYVAAASREALFRGSALSHRHIIICSRAAATPCPLS